MNKAILIGRLTRDPELRTTPTGRNVCQFSIAVNRTYTNTSGEREADFINCVVWDKQAENLSRYQKKGNQIAVDGRIQTRNYENKDGNKVYITEVVCENMRMLDTRTSSNGGTYLDDYEPNTDYQKDNENTVQQLCLLHTAYFSHLQHVLLLHYTYPPAVQYRPGPQAHATPPQNSDSHIPAKR